MNSVFLAKRKCKFLKEMFALIELHYILQVQLLVEKNKNLDFKKALELAADVQPIKVSPHVIDDVR